MAARLSAVYFQFAARLGCGSNSQFVNQSWTDILKCNNIPDSPGRADAIKRLNTRQALASGQQKLDTGHDAGNLQPVADNDRGATNSPG